MSSSRPKTTIFLDDDVAVMSKKIKSAVSGGQATVEEQRRLGAECDKDVAYQYLTFFFEKDDTALAEIRDSYSSGRILSGEVKQLCIDAASDWLTDLAERRDSWANRLDEFLADDDVDSKT